MFQITIFFLYAAAAVAFALSRLPAWQKHLPTLKTAAFALALAGIIVHVRLLYVTIAPGEAYTLSLSSAWSLIGLQLALIAVLAALDPVLRGMSAGLLVLGAVAALTTGVAAGGSVSSDLTWQIQTHIFVSMFAYGLLTAGAIVAVYALVQDRRLRAARLSPTNHLFAPLETTERLLYGVATAGFVILALAVVSGFTFVENLFAQHLVHKTVLSLFALVMFGVLVAGRQLAGWRGRRAIFLYLSGFAVLGLAYFGSRAILEFLNRSWS